jgi:hypothetical protein
LHDEHGILEVNASWLQLLGYSSLEEVIGKHPSEVSAKIQPGGEPADTMRRCPIELLLAELPAKVHVDERLLRHIFTNVLTNAVKYSDPGNRSNSKSNAPVKTLLASSGTMASELPEPIGSGSLTPFTAAATSMTVPALVLGWSSSSAALICTAAKSKSRANWVKSLQ